MKKSPLFNIECVILFLEWQWKEKRKAEEKLELTLSIFLLPFIFFLPPDDRKHNFLPFVRGNGGEIF